MGSRRRGFDSSRQRSAEPCSAVVPQSERLRQRARAESSDIFWACVYGDIAAVRTFLERDRSVVDARRSHGPAIHPASVGFTPLHEASVRGEDAIVKLLVEYGAVVVELSLPHPPPDSVIERVTKARLRTHLSGTLVPLCS